MNDLTERQIKIIKIIVEKYNNLYEAIGSKLVANNFESEISSQTIRNEMATLEKKGYLLKVHTSSGRIPSEKALNYYSKHLTIAKIDENTKNKLEALFIKREKDIDSVIQDSLTMLSEITLLPSLSNSYNVDETLREVSLVQLNKDNAILMIVTNLANVYKNYIIVDNQDRFNDAKVCIRLINEYLVGTKLINVKEKVNEIIPFIRKEVKEFEYITREIINKLFDITIKKTSNTNIVGITSLSNYPEFQNPKAIFDILHIVESGSIWQQIKYNLDSKDNVIVEYKKIDSKNNDSSMFAIASTEIEYNNIKRQISIIGHQRMEIGKIKGILNHLKFQIEEMFKK